MAELAIVGLLERDQRLGADFWADVLSIALDKGKNVHVSSRSTNAEGDKSTHVDRFDRVVICSGIGSRRLAANLGDRVNVYSGLL